MKPLLKSLSLLIGITCLVWVAVLWHWQATHRDMSTTDIVMFLGLLPTALFVLLIAGRWAFTGVDERAARREAAKSAGVDSSVAARTSSLSGGGEAERQAMARLLWSGIRCAAGSSPATLEASIGQRQPSLDRELVDNDGLPVLTARIGELGVEAMSPPLGMAEQLARRRMPDAGDRQASAALMRALAALSPCLDDLFAALVPWRGRLGGEDAGASPDHKTADDRLPARLLVYAAWPADLSAFDLAVADLWLRGAMEERRDGIVGAGRILRPSADPALTGPELLRHADEAIARMHVDAPTTDLVLLLASESHIVDETVQRWQREGLLCSSRQPKGRVPGEAAAAVLLAPVDWATDDDARHALLHRPALAERDRSIDAAGRIDAQVATRVVEQALAAAGAPAASVATVACDADQATPRGLETHAAVYAALPHLDAADDVILAGTICGHIGAASTLVVIALAAHRALESGHPCVALSVGDPTSRAAVVVRGVEPGADQALTVDRVA